jgi:large subunit ribosomal protein L17
MVTSLLKHERIRTTDVKAKELRRWVDHIVTLAKRGDLHARRQALSIVREKAVVHKLFDDAPERFGAVSGGYTRIIKMGRRPGDAAPMSLVELVQPAAGGGKPAKKAAAPMEIETPDLQAPAPAVETEAAPEAETETAEAAAPESGAADAEAETPVDAAAAEPETAGEEESSAPAETDTLDEKKTDDA